MAKEGQTVNLQAKRKRADAGGHGAATVEPFSKTVNRVLSVRGFESPPLRQFLPLCSRKHRSGQVSSAVSIFLNASTSRARRPHQTADVMALEVLEDGF
jgi:hypothetical protein